MAEGTGASNNFIQRYLTLTQPYSPGSQPNDRTFNLSMQDGQDVPYSQTSKRMLECQRVLDRISTFACQENIGQRISFLEQELAVYGYPPIVSGPNGQGQYSPQGGALDLVTLVNTSYDLLQCWRQAVETQSEAVDVQRTSEAEIVRLRHLNSRLKEDISTKDRELKSKELMHLQLSQRIESLKKKFKSEQDKVKRLTGEMAARDSQFRHEKKKKVQETEKLQARLQQLLQDKRQERILGIEILNSLQRTDGKRGKWSTDKTKKNTEQDMYRLIITNYEDSQKQLLKENEGMRKYLKEMQNELISALNERNAPDLSHSSAQEKTEAQDEEQPGSSRSSSAASNKSEGSEVSEHMSDGMFEMPYDLVKEDIERSIRTKWKAIKKEIRKSRRPDKPLRVKKADDFVDEVEYDDLVQQQQDLIDYLTGQDKSSGRPTPDDCYFLEEKAELEKKKNLFEQQKKSFEKERKVYAEALLQFEEQRQAFEGEKNRWLQQNFLQMTPFRSDGRPSTSPSQNLRGKEPSTHHGKARQQPYQPRASSTSPDKPALRISDPSPSYHRSPGNSIQSPNNMSHSLSRLHSSSQHNSFSPDNMQPRIPQHGWLNRTPENPGQQQQFSQVHRGKSAPNASITNPPPSTAELYRTLGLVYYGSDKENEDVGSTAGNEQQICPLSSGTSGQVAPDCNGNSRLNQQEREMTYRDQTSNARTDLSEFRDHVRSSAEVRGQARLNSEGHPSLPGYENKLPMGSEYGHLPKSNLEDQVRDSSYDDHSSRQHFEGQRLNFPSQSSRPDVESRMPMTNLETHIRGLNSASRGPRQDRDGRQRARRFNGHESMPKFQNPQPRSKFEGHDRPGFQGQMSRLNADSPKDANFNDHGQWAGSEKDSSNRGVHQMMPNDFQGHERSSKLKGHASHSSRPKPEGHPQRSILKSPRPRSRVEPRSGDRVRSRATRHRSSITPRGSQGSHTGAAQVKAPNNGKSHSHQPASPEYLSATASLDSEEQSTSSDYYDADNGVTERGQKVTSRESNPGKLRDFREKCVESVSAMSNEFKLSGDVPRVRSKFNYSPPQKQKMRLSKSLNEKMFRDDAEESCRNKPKRSGIRGFMKTLLLGQQKHKRHNSGHARTADHNKILSSSDSLLTLSHFLDQDVEKGVPRCLHPSTGPTAEAASPTVEKFEVSHQRTQSFPSSDVIDRDFGKQRSHSFDAPALSMATERHKCALLYLSSNLKTPESPESVFDPLSNESKSPIHSLSSAGERFQKLLEMNAEEFKCNSNQLGQQVYNQWSHTSIAIDTQHQVQPKPDESDFHHPKATEASFNQPKPVQSGFNHQPLQGAEESVPELESLFSNQSDPVSANPSPVCSSQSGSISSPPSSYVLLEKVALQQSSSSASEEDHSGSNTSDF